MPKKHENTLSQQQIDDARIETEKTIFRVINETLDIVLREGCSDVFSSLFMPMIIVPKNELLTILEREKNGEQTRAQTWQLLFGFSCPHNWYT